MKINVTVVSLSIVVAFIATHVMAQSKEVTPVGKYCEKVSGLTTELADYIGSRLKVDARNISFIESRAMKDDYYLCPIRVHTAKGPQNCSATSIYLIQGKYIAGGSCM